jgi:Phage Tail Collar Domain
MNNNVTRSQMEKLLALIEGGLNERSLTRLDIEGVILPEIEKMLSGRLLFAGDIFFRPSVAQRENGALPCDGSLQSRAIYPTLLKAIGTTYGAGDGLTTFQLPSIADYAGLKAFIKT